MRSASTGIEPAVERVEQVAVDHRRRVHELGRIGEVTRALLVHVDRRVRKGAGHVAHAAGVIEVDVGDGDARQVVGADAERVERSQQLRHRRLAAGLHQHGLGTLDEVAGGDRRPPAEQRVDLQHAVTDAFRHEATVAHTARLGLLGSDVDRLDGVPHGGPVRVRTGAAVDLGQYAQALLDLSEERERWVERGAAVAGDEEDLAAVLFFAS